MKQKFCGDCGQPYSNHIGKEEYCYTDTNGNWFTDEPCSEALITFLENEKQELYKSLILEWKKENGHL